VRVLIDSSAWIEFLNGSPSRTSDEVSRLLGSESEICTCGLVVTEVLQGLRRESGYPKVVKLFADLTFLEVVGFATYVRAAEVYRVLRRRGTTVRSTVDCLIAILAEEQGCVVLARDRDLEAILGSGLLKSSPYSATDR
jgi:predicted nucleic acid-binding protein